MHVGRMFDELIHRSRMSQNKRNERLSLTVRYFATDESFFIPFTCSLEQGAKDGKHAKLKSQTVALTIIKN